MSFQDWQGQQQQPARGRASSTGSAYNHSTGVGVVGGATAGAAGSGVGSIGRRTTSSSYAQQSGGGFGSAGALRTGGVGVGRPGATGDFRSGALHQGGLGQRPSNGVTSGAARGVGGASGGGKVGDYLMVYSQNISMLHRMVQQLGTARDTAELRGQCRCQLEVVNELEGKIQTELRQQQQVAEGASRQEAARIGAMNAKLTKDFNRVKALATELGTQAERRMREVDTQRQLQLEADEARAREAFGGADRRRQQQGMLEAQQRQERVQMQEEAINTAIIQETEEELQQINKSLYKVNEIYRDLASIVEQQSEAVEQIETNTEGAHARAQEGLVQVQKANNYQPSCTIS